jgi:aminopeptidase N
LNQFRRWYNQAGTPRIQVRSSFDARQRRYTLHISQRNPRVGVERLQDIEKPPLHIPFSIGFVGADGADLPVRMESDTDGPVQTTRVLSVTKPDETFEFIDLGEAPTPSLLRDFSAPVLVDYPYSDDELAHLSAHDSDPFNRWDAMQRLAVRTLAARVRDGTPIEKDGPLTKAFRATLAADHLDPMLRALALTLPAEYVIGEDLPVYDPQAVHSARNELAALLGTSLATEWRATFLANTSTGPYTFERSTMAKRALAHCALQYLAAAGTDDAGTLAWRLFINADNMTDRHAALQILVNHELPKASEALAKFYSRHKAQSTPTDKWLRIQSTAELGCEKVLPRVKALLAHPAFSSRNPNNVVALLGGFFMSNPSAFHHAKAYAFWVEQVAAIDRINPSSGARLARALDRWQRLPEALQEAAQKALAKLAREPQLSRAVREIIDKALRV